MQLKKLVFILLMQFIAGCQLETVKCGPNEMPGPECGTMCPPSCPMPVPGICTDICILNACICKPGFIRKVDLNSPCIPKSQCPPRCGPNEVYTKCNYTTCQAACDRTGQVNCPLENINCVGGCLCKENYMRLTYKNLSSPCVSKCPCTT